MACSYFAKDLPRLMKQKQAKNWEKYDIEGEMSSVLFPRALSFCWTFPDGIRSSMSW
jgi:hypothetical protein